MLINVPMLTSCKKVFFTCFNIVWYWENKRNIPNASGLFHYSLYDFFASSWHEKNRFNFLYIYFFLGFTIYDLKYNFLLQSALSVLFCAMATGFKPQVKVLAIHWRFYHKFLSEVTHSFVKVLLHKDQSNWNQCAASSAHLVIFWPILFYSCFLD